MNNFDEELQDRLKKHTQKRVKQIANTIKNLAKKAAKKVAKNIAKTAKKLITNLVKTLVSNPLTLKFLLILLCVIGVVIILIQALDIIGVISLGGSGSTFNGTNTSYNSSTACIDGLVYDNPDAPVYTEFGDNATDIRETIRPYLQKKGYEQYIDIIVALSAQESGCGTGSGKSNWMQVKGYNGPPGVSSMYAGIDHFINLIETYCVPQNCTDISILIQSYNYGCGYVSYCMSNGGKETKALRQQFQKEHDSGKGYGDVNYVDKALKRIIGQKPADAGYSQVAYSDDEQLQKLLDKADQQIGKPYVWAAAGPNSFDCSGLVFYCCKSVGLNNMPRTSNSQYNYCKTFTDEKDAKPGDLVFFAYQQGKGAVHHVGIYVGNGKYIHAPRTGKNVEYANLSSRNDRKAFGRIPR